MKYTAPVFHADPHRRRRGLTLVEVMLSAAIIAVLAVLVAGALFYPARLVVSSARRQAALHAAGSDMERVAAMNYASLAATNYNIGVLNQILTVNRTVTPGSGFATVTVVVLDPDGEQLVELVTERTPE